MQSRVFRTPFHWLPYPTGTKCPLLLVESGVCPRQTTLPYPARVHTHCHFITVALFREGVEPLLNTNIYGARLILTLTKGVPSVISSSRGHMSRTVTWRRRGGAVPK